MNSLSVLSVLLVASFYIFGNVGAADTCTTIQGLEGCACRMENSERVMSLQELVGNNTNGNPIR